MKITPYLTLLLLSLFTAMCASPHVIASDEHIIHTIDFSKVPAGDAHQWLIEQGYLLKLDATSLQMEFNNQQLEIATDDEIAGLVVLKLGQANWLHDVSSIDIEWGVVNHPQTVDWEQGENKVAVALMFFFGEKNISSGLPFGINSAPYFISPFIGYHEVAGKTYTGFLYKKGGRYVCVDVTNGSDELIRSHLQVTPRFFTEFNKKSIPAITHIAFQMNAKDSESGAKAFIKKIIFNSKG